MSSSTLELAIDFLQSEVAPRAQEIDRDGDALRAALKGLCDRNLMALKRPMEYGGPALPEEEFRKFQEECARASGSLAFLQTQHQSASGLIARSSNEELKSEYLPKMGNGEKLVGIGFSQLRRGGPPMMKAEETGGGYVLNGTVPWVTGWGFYPEFLMGATLPSGEALFGIVPLKNENGIRVSPVMKLAAMETPNTVSVGFEKYKLPIDKVVFTQSASWIKNNDQINITLQGHFALGCAQAGLDILKANAEKKPLPFIMQAHDSLAYELKRCREETKRAQATPTEETTQERLNVRAWAIDLAVRCAHAAVTASSGAANSVDHPAQRVYREALVYTVSAQTTEIMEATLRRITHSPERAMD